MIEKGYHFTPLDPLGSKYSEPVGPLAKFHSSKAFELAGKNPQGIEEGSPLRKLMMNTNNMTESEIKEKKRKKEEIWKVVNGRLIITDPVKP